MTERIRRFRPMFFIIIRRVALALSLVATMIFVMVAIDPTPKDILAKMGKQGGMDIMGSDLFPLLKSLDWQGSWNARAQIMTAVSVILQGGSLLFEGR
jgi:hypothetical protein